MADENTIKRRKRNAQRREEQRENENERPEKERDRPDYDDYAVIDPSKIEEGSDVIVDVPVIKVDKVEVEVDDLTAQVAVVAEVRRLAELSVGAVAHLDKVELEIEGVESGIARGRVGWTGDGEEDPNTKIQKPKKSQIPRSK